jgi:polyhydroxyalkanoate synthesis regulator phasin
MPVYLGSMTVRTWARQIGLMKELIDRLVSKAQLSPEQATKAADTVRLFLSEKLPGPIKSQVESAISGENVGKAAEQAKDFIGKRS